MTEGRSTNDNSDKNVTTRTTLQPPFRRDIDIGCGLGILVLDFQYLCIIMTRIDLSPYMVDRYSKRSVPVVVDGGKED